MARLKMKIRDANSMFIALKFSERPVGRCGRYHKQISRLMLIEKKKQNFHLKLFGELVRSVYDVLRKFQILNYFQSRVIVRGHFASKYTHPLTPSLYDPSGGIKS